MTALRRRRPSAIPTEAQFHYEVAGYLASHLMPPFFAWHTPNGGKRGILEAARLKKMGTKAGIPDLFILGRGRLYALELKREKGGRVSESQTEVMAKLAAAGCAGKVCRTMDEVKAALAEWGIPLFAGGRFVSDPVMGAMRNSFDVVT